MNIESARGRGRAAIVLGVAAAMVMLCLPGAALAKGRVSTSYGVLGKRTIHATAIATGVRKKASVVLETRQYRTRGKRVSCRRGAASLSAFMVLSYD